ncbi:MAG: hypothetical protein COZ06_21550 [Armatimonadetes bacterium CG_4_10_14_3_um_filter_66_18]|nr:MAG: hypothetical protein COZ06_21550 [Armatimonadetes bacterium CG_4_10_14_3_um_filter_66_18]PJB61521.1 MAG: hypothetical protein CO096_28525 [Armatimonadetes bacterium CG_4_9_14_3_um_filter_66_14]
MTQHAPQQTTPFPPESQTVEWKQSLGEWREIVETCAAFASVGGGRLYIGVAPDGCPAQLEVGTQTLERLANRIAENTHPKIVPAIRAEEVSGTHIVVVEVPPSATKPVFAFDRAFRRSGRTNQRLDPDEAARLCLATRGMTWDTRTFDDLGMEDVDADLVRRFLRRAKRERQWEAPENAPPEAVLGQLELLQHQKLTVAGNLFFGKRPQRQLVQAQVRCARFKGNDTVTFIDMKVIERDVLSQVEDAMEFVQRNISMAVEFKGGGPARLERWEYPLEAVREAIVNAVCHRDYAATGNAQLSIFDDSLQVWNPGGLPPGLTVGDLRGVHLSIPRNKLIA